MIEIKNLEKSFKGNKILKNISFSLSEGEILTLLGPSGAGKTTILRILNGLESCDKGSILIDGEYICDDGNYKNNYDLTFLHKKIGLVFQNFNLFPHMNILENLIAAPIHTLNMSKKEAISKAMIILKSLNLDSKATSYPFELSGGQKQRVAIGRALMLNPKYICFDEPTSALDPKLTLEIANIIKNLSKSSMGILIITHDMDFAKKASTRVIELSSGEILTDSSASEFFK